MNLGKERKESQCDADQSPTESRFDCNNCGASPMCAHYLNAVKITYYFPLSIVSYQMLISASTDVSIRTCLFQTAWTSFESLKIRFNMRPSRHFNSIYHSVAALNAHPNQIRNGTEFTSDNEHLFHTRQCLGNAHKNYGCPFFHFQAMICQFLPAKDDVFEV